MTRSHSVYRVGSLVARGRSVGLVLEVAGDRLLLAPITPRGFPQLAGDVELDDSCDLALAGRERGAVVRLSAAVGVSARGQRLLGELSEGAQWWVAQVRARLFVEAGLTLKWRAERVTYRDHLAGERCVKL